MNRLREMECSKAGDILQATLEDHLRLCEANRCEILWLLRVSGRDKRFVRVQVSDIRPPCLGP